MKSSETISVNIIYDDIKVKSHINKNTQIKKIVNKFFKTILNNGMKMINNFDTEQFYHKNITNLSNKKSILFDGMICKDTSTPKEMNMYDGSTLMIMSNQIGGACGNNFVVNNQNFDHINIDLMEVYSGVVNNVYIDIKLSDVFCVFIDENNCFSLCMKKTYYERFNSMKFMKQNEKIICILSKT